MARSLRGVAQRDRLQRIVLHHAEADVVVELVHAAGVVFLVARRAALEHHHRKRRARGQLLGHQQAGPAAADDHRIGFGQGLHALDSIGVEHGLHVSSSLGLYSDGRPLAPGSPAWAGRPRRDTYRSRAKLLMRGPGKPISCQPTMSTLPPCCGSQNMPSMVLRRSKLKKSAAFDLLQLCILLGGSEIVEAGQLLQPLAIDLLRAWPRPDSRIPAAPFSSNGACV